LVLCFVLSHVEVGTQRRGSWVDWGELMLSKAELMLFCNELQKQLGVCFTPPPVSVNLSSTTSAFPGGVSLPPAPPNLLEQMPTPPMVSPQMQTPGFRPEANDDAVPKTSFSGLDIMFPKREPQLQRTLRARLVRFG